MRLRFLGGFAVAGYVTDAVAGAVAYQLGGIRGVVLAAQLVNILFLFLAIGAAIRWAYRSYRARRAAPLGTYAKSDSHPPEGGGAVPGGWLR